MRRARALLGSRWIRPLAGVVLVVLGALARWPYAFSRVTPELQPDSFAYFGIADGLRAGHVFYASGNTRGPGYPAFIALAGLLPGEPEPNVILAQHVVGLLVAVGFLVWAWKALGPATALLGGLVLVISPLLFIVEDEALPDLLVGALLLALGIGLATVAIRDGGRVGARWVVALGVLVGVAALVKPVAEAALVAPLLTFAAARWPRRAVLRGELLVLAGFAIAVGPFVVHSVIRFGEPSLVRNSGDTLFARVFEIDQRPIPTDTTDGREVAAAIQGEPGVRPYITARVALEKSHGGDLRGVDRRERALAFDAIAKYPFRYAWRTIELSDQFLVQSFASPHVVDVFHPRAGPSATGLSDLLFEVGGWLSRRWWVLSLHGFAFLLAMTVGPRRRRIACISLVAVAAPVALLTAASHGGLPRYSWSLLPITYTVGIAGVVSGVLALRRGARGTPAW